MRYRVCIALGIVFASFVCVHRRCDQAAVAAAAAPVTGAAEALPNDAACGRTSLPDCPLQQWMKANASSAVLAHDYARLAHAFERLEDLGPPEYASWRSIAEEGRTAALADDMDAVRRACKRCHEEHRPSYRREHRMRPIH